MANEIIRCQAIRFVQDDGGREAAGFRGSAGDCAVRSIAIATGKPYLEVYNAINVFSLNERVGKRKRGISNARTGVYSRTLRRYLDSIGWHFTPTMSIGSGCKVHLRASELPAGRLIISLSKHITAVVDQVVHDMYDPSRDGTRCVYGFWSEGK